MLSPDSSMQLSLRTLFAVALWSVALVPPALLLANLSSPVAAVQIALTLEAGLGWGATAAVGGVIAALLLYPPFLPGMRLALNRMKSRLSADIGPLREAQGRLQHLETAADHLIAGRALLAQRKLVESVAHLTRAVELDPTHTASRYHLGLALVRAGHLQAAAEQLSQVVEVDPAHAFGAAMLELGVVLERGGADQPAVGVFERHDREFGWNRRSGYHHARSLARIGRREEALTLLRKTARAPDQGKLPLEEELLRARARVALLRGGKL